MEVYSANEYWVKAASLFTTDPAGHEGFARPSHGPLLLHFQPSAWHRKADDEGELPAVPESAGLRAGAARVVGRSGRVVDQGRRAAAERIPRLADGTLVPPAAAKWSWLSEDSRFTYTGLKSTRYLFDYGPDFYRTGIMAINPPAVKSPIFNNRENGPIYPSYVPKTDADGNDIAGIRLPDVAVPLGHLYGLGSPFGAASERRLRSIRTIHSLPEDQG